MPDQDTMTEYFEMSYCYSYENGEAIQKNTSQFKFPGGTSLYVEGGVFDVFCQFLRGAGYNPVKIEEALENL